MAAHDRLTAEEISRLRESLRAAVAEGHTLEDIAQTPIVSVEGLERLMDGTLDEITVGNAGKVRKAILRAQLGELPEDKEAAAKTSRNLRIHQAWKREREQRIRRMEAKAKRLGLGVPPNSAVSVAAVTAGVRSASGGGPDG